MLKIFNEEWKEEYATLYPQKFEKSFVYNGTEVLSLTVENFEVALKKQQVESIINNNINKQTSNFINFVSGEMFRNAIKDYKENTDGAPFNPYGAFMNYTSTYNENCILSTYYDKYTYTGGAHGSTVRFGTSYSLKTGKILPLSYWFKQNYKERVLKKVSELADEFNAENPDLLFEDYHSLIIENFNEKSYYLTPEGLVIYYGQYDIAPYVAGIIEFTIPFSELDVQPSC